MTTEPYGKKNPFPAPVVDERPLTGEGSPKETIHIDFSLEGSGLEYVSGDALAVIPQNDPELVDELINELGFSAIEPVTTPDGLACELRDALINHYDITGVKKPFLTKWLALTGNPELEALLAAEDKAVMSNYLWGRDILDVAREFPAKFESAEQFIVLLKKIMPRLYSIASSPNFVKGQVGLCVGAVRYTERDRKRGGVCSTYMADRLKAGNTAKVFIHTNKNFRLPADGSKTIIMVGPGTGIAPFRSFWQERVHAGATGINWLFFGNPYKATDFCYEDEITKLVEEGKLKLSIAWSRDQAEKVYVQHLMIQEGEGIWQQLQEGAYFYVCGDAARMAKDVDNALKQIAETYGKLSAEEAEAYVADLKKAHRYQRDVY